jgi:hypothetical protein
MYLVSKTSLILVNVMVIYEHKIHRIPICMEGSSRDVGAPGRLAILHTGQLIISH